MGDRTWEEAAEERPVLLVPVGSCEQHGPHLPLDTDTRIAVAIAEAAAARLGVGVVVTPPVAIGASGEHAGFPGTLSIGVEVLTSVLVELGRSADWAAGVVFVNGHGGNHEALVSAAAELVAEGRAAGAWSPRFEGGDAHAGRTETSLLLHLAPSLVRPERAAPGATESLATLLPRLRESGVAAVSTNGVLGDPAGASAEEGRSLLHRAVDQLVSFSSPGATRGPAGPR